MNEINDIKTTQEKALEINLDSKKYGTIVEIGAGQEVARHFFRVGAAAGTIAKTMSAYDMQVSDAIYGVQENKRYVSKARVKAMMEVEFKLLLERLKEKKSANYRYFTYAATASTRSFKGGNESHAWCGIRLQMYPGAQPSDIVLHIRMKDKDATEQQEVLGILGVNLIYAAYYYFENPTKIIDSLTDNLAQDRMEVDSIEFYGPYFDELNNKEISLHLIKSWKTRAVMFLPNGEVCIPANILYKKNVLTIRGSFKPVTKLNVDMIEKGFESFTKQDDINSKNTIILAEISLTDDVGNYLDIQPKDVMERVSLLNSLGYSVMVSDYARYFSLRAYFRQFTQKQIGIVLGISNLKNIFDESVYDGVEGGILEGFGKLFPDNTKLFVYPELGDNNKIIDFEKIELAKQLRFLYRHLLENQYIMGIETSNKQLFSIYSREVLKKLQKKEQGWEKSLPDGIAEQIIENGFFNYKK